MPRTTEELQNYSDRYAECFNQAEGSISTKQGIEVGKKFLKIPISVKDLMAELSAKLRESEDIVQGYRDAINPPKKES